MVNVNSGCRGLRMLRKHSPTLTLVLGVLVNSAAAQTPGNLKWWSDDDAASPMASDAAADVSGARSFTTSRAVENSVEPSPQLPPSDLGWWESQGADSELNWWKAKREGQSLRWWSPNQPSVRQVAAQQTPFGRKPDEATPAEPPAQPTPPIEGRTPGAADVEFDPFDVVPPIKPLTDIVVTLAPSQPVPIDVATADPAFVGTASEYFAAQGSTFLTPHTWPQRTPEAAAYQFCSRPLWYEDANVERCGETCGCVQPVVSGTYFFANSLLLPYRFAAEPQCQTVPQKQFCPPGCRYSCCQNYLPPWSPAGAVAEGAAITGLIFLVP